MLGLGRALTLTACLVAQTATAQSLGQPAGEAAPLGDAFEAKVEALLERFTVPGVAIGVVKDGALVYARGFGLRSVADELPVTPDTLFAIGSTTKAFTAASVGLFVDEGRFTFDTPVADLMPDFRLKDAYATRHATPRDLLAHRTGLPRHDLVWYGSDATREELFARLRYLEPTAGFREKWQYNNLMYMVAGILVGRQEGTTWEDVVQRRLLDALGMSRANLSVTATERDDDAARPHAKVGDELVAIPYRNLDAVGPAGSINASVRDMAQWLKMLLGRGALDGQRILGEATLAEILKPAMVMPDSNIGALPEFSHASYGLGWVYVDYRGRPLHWHSGGIDGFIAHVSFMPDQGVGLVVLQNAGHVDLPFMLALTAYDEILGAPDGRWDERLAPRGGGDDGDGEDEPRDPAPRPLSDYVGTYHDPGYGRVVIEEAADGLTLRYNTFTLPLTHVRHGVFRVVGLDVGDGRAVFQVDAAGDVAAVDLKLDDLAGAVRFTKQDSLPRALRLAR